MTPQKLQILFELQHYVNQQTQAIAEQDAIINAEAFVLTTVTGGALASAARSACQTRMEAAQAKKAALEYGIAWAQSMLDEYKKAGES